MILSSDLVHFSKQNQNSHDKFRTVSQLKVWQFLMFLCFLGIPKDVVGLVLVFTWLSNQPVEFGVQRVKSKSEGHSLLGDKTWNVCGRILKIQTKVVAFGHQVIITWKQQRSQLWYLQAFYFFFISVFLLSDIWGHCDHYFGRHKRYWQHRHREVKTQSERKWWTHTTEMKWVFNTLTEFLPVKYVFFLSFWTKCYR